MFLVHSLLSYIHSSYTYHFFQDAGEGLIELRKIETAEGIAKDLAKARNVAYLPPNQNTLLSLPQ